MLADLMFHWSLWEIPARRWFFQMNPEAQRAVLSFWFLLMLALCWLSARRVVGAVGRLQRARVARRPRPGPDPALAMNSATVRKLRSMVLTDDTAKRLMVYELRRGAANSSMAAEWAIERLIRDRK
ncbi:MAG: hypothetical protein V7668_15100 [Cereibacter changlensis]